MVKGFLLMICASVLLGCIPTANQFVMLHGVSSSALVFYTFLLAAIGSAVLIVLTKKSFRVSVRQVLMLFFVGTLGLGGTNFLLNSAYSYISVGLTTMLHFLYPSIVAVVMVIIFRQRLTALKAAAVAVSIAGMLLLSNVSGGGKMAGVVLALCSSCTYAFYIIANDQGSINSLPLIVKLFYTSASACLLFGLFSVRELGLPDSPGAGAVLFFFCGCGTLAAFFLLTAGIKLIGASAASFLNMLEPVVSMVVSSIVYQTVIEARTVWGCAIILLSVLLIALDGRQAEKRNCRLKESHSGL